MQGYFLVVDLLGFGAIVRNSSDEARKARVQRWVDLVDTAATAASIAPDRLQLISDTVFVGLGPEAESLAQLVMFARNLLNRGVPTSLPTRTGIAFGEYEWGRLTHGPAVIEAYQLQHRQNWVGATCAGKLPNVKELIRPESLVVYPVPMKDGPVILTPAVVWKVPSPADLVAGLSREGLTQEGEVLSWTFGEKYNNTVQFGVYLELVRSGQRSATGFRGASVMQAIAEDLT